MSTRRVESFLLRIVVPDSEANAPERWRGRIQHVASGAELKIDELAQAVAFITAHIDQSPVEIVEREEVSGNNRPRRTRHTRHAAR